MRALRFAPASLAAVALALVAGSAPVSGEDVNGDEPYVPGRLLLRLKGRGDGRAIAASQGARVAGEIPGIGVLVIELPRNANEHAVAAAFQRDREVEFAELDTVATVEAVTPNDTSYASQWHLPKIQAPQAWDTTTGSSSVVLAVVDSGVDASHPDLGAKVLAGTSFIGGTGNTDTYGHGTKVAGSAAALTNNAMGVAGVAWGVSILPVKVVDSTGNASYSNIANGIIWATDRGASVINVSISGTTSSSTLQNAVNYAWNRGVIVVCSAGNDGATAPHYPAACTNAVAVSATDRYDAVTSWSTRGTWVDVSAPGSGIYTTTLSGGYASVSGTSFSAPITAGVLALIRSAVPGISAADAVTALTDGCDDLGVPGFDADYGAGRVNAAAALAAALGEPASSTTDTAAPSASIAAPTAGATVSGMADVAVSATDDVAVAYVELRVDGVLVATDTGAPWSLPWNTTTMSEGSHSLVARAVDASGKAGESSAVTCTVSNAADTVAPVVAITSPSTGATVSKTFTVATTATDAGGVSRVELYLDGAMVSTLTAAPYNFTLNPRRWKTGSHTLVAKAYDGAGNAGTSATVTVKR